MAELSDRPPAEEVRGGFRSGWRVDAVLWLTAAFFLALLGSLNGNNLIVLIGALMAGYSLTASYLASHALKGIVCERILPESVFAQAEFEVILRLRKKRSWLPCVCLSLLDSLSDKTIGLQRKMHLFCLSGGGTSTVRYTARITRRGEFVFRDVFAECDLPFILLRRRVLLPCVSHLTVFPRLGSFRGEDLERLAQIGGLLAVASPFRDGEADFCGIHEFREGDNPKYIHWRTTARFEQLMVREHHRYQGRRALFILDLNFPEKQRGIFERGVSLTATLACELCKRNFQVGLATGGEFPMWLAPSPGEKALGGLLGALAAVQPAESDSLDTLPLPSFFQGGHQTLCVFVSLREPALVREKMSRLQRGETRYFHPGSECFTYRLDPEEAEEVKNAAV